MVGADYQLNVAPDAISYYVSRCGQSFAALYLARKEFVQRVTHSTAYRA
jgi:hypothetical protein